MGTINYFYYLAYQRSEIERKAREDEEKRIAADKKNRESKAKAAARESNLPLHPAIQQRVQPQATDLSALGNMTPAMLEELEEELE